MLDTNFYEADLLSLALLFKNNLGGAIEYRQIPGHAGAANVPLLQTELSYWLPDKNEVRDREGAFEELNEKKEGRWRLPSYY